jgi:Short C-terminal domain
MIRRRPLLRAAAVGGGAYMAGKSVARRQAESQYQEEEQNARLDSVEQQQGGYGSYPPQGAPPPAAPPPAAEPSMMDQLTQLADLHKQGILTDEEFAAAKAKLIGS